MRDRQRIGPLSAISARFGLLLVLITSASGSQLKPNETVQFLSGIATPEANGWRIDIHGRVNESEYHKPLTALFRRSLGIRDDELTPAELATFREQAYFFLVDNERHKRILVQLGNVKLE